MGVNMMERLSLTWGGYMESGDVVLACNSMVRYIIVSKAPKPSQKYQIQEFGEVVHSSWVVLVSIRFGDVVIHPTSMLRPVKSCGYSEFVQAIENLKPCDRYLLDFLKPNFSGYKCAKRDQGSIFIK
jgi:hypothetical protein